MFTTLVDHTALFKHLGNSDWVVVDCRFDLARPDDGYPQYLAMHVPGAVYAHLDRDLSGPPVTNRGRHPLPVPAALCATFERLGISSDKQVIVYDNAGGSICARLWWLIHYMGHESVAVLDGGWQAWLAAGHPTASGAESNAPGHFEGQPRAEWVVTVEQVTQAPILFDSRDPARFRGEVEPIDPVAGHIPGARNCFWKDNVNVELAFRPAAELRARFTALLGDIPATESVFYCGSGVTACHNLLAVKHAGLPMPRLYAGSWSEWCADPVRPVAVGSD